MLILLVILVLLLIPQVRSFALALGWFVLTLIAIGVLFIRIIRNNRRRKKDEL